MWLIQPFWRKRIKTASITKFYDAFNLYCVSMAWPSMRKTIVSRYLIFVRRLTTYVSLCLHQWGGLLTDGLHIYDSVTAHTKYPYDAVYSAQLSCLCCIFCQYVCIQSRPWEMSVSCLAIRCFDLTDLCAKLVCKQGNKHCGHLTVALSQEGMEINS